MIDTFKARLKAKFPKINFTQKRVDTIAEKLNKKFPDLTEEADHDAKIDDYYDEKDLVEIDKIDHVLEEAGKSKPTETTTTVTKTEEKPKTEIEKLTELVTGLATTVQTLTAERAQQTIQSKIKDKLKDIPEKFWNKRVLPEKEEDIENFATEVSTDYAEIVPKNASYQPGKANGKPAPANEKTINNMVDQLMGVQQPANTN